MNFKKIKATLISLLVMNNTPHGIALGVALGVFIAVTPLYGLHTAMFVLAAMLVRRANKAAILIGTNISLPPTMPFITWGAYEIGRFILPLHYPELGSAYFGSLGHFSFWKMFKLIRHLYPPLFVGSIVLGIALGALFYLATFVITRRLKKSKPQ